VEVDVADGEEAVGYTPTDGEEVDVADDEEAVGYTPSDGEEVEVYAPEEADADEEDAEEFELPVMKLATGGPGNVY